MGIKHNLSLMNSIDNPLVGLIFDVNHATGGFLIYSILFLVFAVSSFVFNRKTNDIGKSMLSSLYITSLLALILFYGGKMQGIELVSEVVMLTLLVATAVSLAAIYFTRHSKNQ